METTKSTSRRTTATTVPRSLQHHRIGSALSLPESRSTRRSPSPQQPITRPSRSAASSPRPSVERPRSTIKLRTTSTSTSTATRGKDVKRDEPELQYHPTKKLLPSINSPKILNNSSSSSSSDELARLSLRRSSPHNTSMRRLRSTLTGSPSAWALSPGRTLATLPPSSPSSPSPSLMSSPSLERTTSKERTSSSSLSSSVWRYFQRQKRPSPEEEEGFHQYRIMYNRLLQWRFANAKAEASTSVIKKKGEEKLFAVWVKVCKMRNSIAEKTSRMERLRLKVKLLGIVCPQLDLLDQWELLEKRNTEAVARVARKLSAFSTKLPLVDGAKVDIIDIYEGMRFAMEVLQDIEIHITKFLSRTEDTCNILTQVVHNMGEHDKSFQVLEKSIEAIMSLEAEEKSLRANLLQANKEVWESQNSCKYHRFISLPSSGRIFNPLYSLLLNVS